MLDVGAGSGEMARAIQQHRAALECQGVDVYVRPKTYIPVAPYDGRVLPFSDHTFDAVIAVDVLHHCTDPVSVLRECARVSRRWVLIKDHIGDSLLARRILGFMDWVGNGAHGVALPYNYLSSKEWDAAFEACRLHSRAVIRSLRIYPIPFSLVFDGQLHFAQRLEKLQT